MKLRLNSRNGHKPVVLKPVPKPSPMNWRPQTADDLIGQARSVCVAQVAKARRVRDARNAACKLLLYGPPGVGKTTVAELVARELVVPVLLRVRHPVVEHLYLLAVQDLDVGLGVVGQGGVVELPVVVVKETETDAEAAALLGQADGAGVLGRRENLVCGRCLLGF